MESALEKNQYQKTQKIFPLSQEIFLRLKSYEMILTAWQKKINLISDSDRKQIFDRHILDSLQLAKYISKSHNIADIGSGAGFPGMVLAIVGYDMTLIESDKRKSIFLSEIARELQVKITVENKRAEEMVSEFDIVMARACAPLDKLLPLANGLLGPDTTCLFLKGKNYISEIGAAQKKLAVRS